MLLCETTHRHLGMRAACNAKLTNEERASRFLVSPTSLFSGVTNSRAALCTVNWSGRTHQNPSPSLVRDSLLQECCFFLLYISTCSCTGSWTVQLEKGGTVVVLRSLLWLGLTFYHVPMTKQYGYVYFGTGEKNLDLPFMLWLSCLGRGRELENI